MSATASAFFWAARLFAPSAIMDLRRAQAAAQLANNEKAVICRRVSCTSQLSSTDACAQHTRHGQGRLRMTCMAIADGM
eukprot:6179772-Pleurochrysis_carterae.AAC.1